MCRDSKVHVREVGDRDKSEMVHFRSRGCARSGARRYTGNCGPVYGEFTDALTRPISKRQTRCWKRSIDADARLGHQRSFSLWVAEQDQHQRIELKPAVTRRLRVIDAREHRGAGLPQAGVK